MASLREWIALTLSALLFSVVAGYGVGRALNAKNEAPAPRPAQSAVAIVDRTGEPTAPIGALSASEMEMPSVVASAPAEPPIVPPPPPAMTQAPTPVSTQPVVTAPTAVIPPPPAPPPAPAVAAQTSPVPVLPVAAGERASVLISFADQRLYLMAGERVLASYRVRFGFDPARVKPGETKIQAKAAGKQLELGWKSFPVTAGGERGFILSPADFDALAARLPVGAQVSTTRERVGSPSAPPAAAGSSNARATPAPRPSEPPQRPTRETPAADAEQPAFLAAAPRPR